MTDPRRELILIADRGGGGFADKTAEVASCTSRPDGKLAIVYTSSSKSYAFSAERVRILRQPVRVSLIQGQLAEVDGVIWESATEVCTFRDQDESWSRVFYPTGRGEAHSLRPASQVRIVANVADSPAAARILGYWRDIVSRLGTDDPLKPVYASLGFIHPESALGRYLAAHRSSRGIWKRPRSIPSGAI